MNGLHPIRGQQGFSLVEVLVAAFVLLIGLLGTVALLIGASSATSLTNSRVAASNLAREVVEYARSTDYDELIDARLPTSIQARPNMGSGTSNPFNVTRRGVTYSVTLSSCVYDDPKDGLGVHPAGTTWCATTAAVAGAPAETNPDDFRRVTVNLAWDSKSRSRTMSQSTLVSNPSGGLGPRIASIATEPASQVTTGTSLSFTVTSDPADAVRWTVDAPGGGGDATTVAALPASAWTIPWTLGTYGTAPFVVDGIYTLATQATNSRGIPGEQKIITIPLNRSIPLAPAEFAGGRNELFSTLVDLAWDISPERDVVGYRVDRETAAGTWTQVCPVTAAYSSKLTCEDTAAPSAASGDLVYRVMAFDRTNILDDASGVRDGTPAQITVGDAGSAPPAPTSLDVVVNADGHPVLDWTQPAGGTVELFRIYRDGTDITDRYDVVSAADGTTYTDSDPGTTARTYRVSAVGDSYNESPLSAPAS